MKLNRTLLASLSLLILVAPSARAEIPARPYPALMYKFEKQTDPPQKIFVAAVDLTNPNVQVHVAPGGPDPDGDGKWQTTLMRPTKIADREGFDLVVNGDFYGTAKGQDAEGVAAQKVFQGGIIATVHGPAKSRGKLWATTQKARATFMMGNNGRPAIGQVAVPPEDAAEAIAGSDIIVKDGKNVAPVGKGFPNGPHPRTAVGFSEGGKVLLLVVVDGRKKGEAIGMSLKELADVMIKHGAEQAMNLDGGGSSMMGIRDPKTGEMKIVNTPSDQRERPVANVIGVSLKRRPTTRPVAAPVPNR